MAVSRLGTESIGEDMDREASALLDTAWAEAQATPLSTVAESLSHVFAEMPSRLAAQRESIEEGR